LPSFSWTPPVPSAPAGPGAAAVDSSLEGIATQTLEPTTTRRPTDQTGVRSRAIYVVVATGSCGVAGYVLVGSFWNYVNPSLGQNWVEDIAWLWGISTVASLALLTVGITALALAYRRRPLPPLGTAIWLRTPLAASPRASRAGTNEQSRSEANT
jgi:hypothetical protein